MKRVSLYLFTSLVAFGLARAQRQTTVRRTGDGGPAIKAEVNAPSSLTVDQFGNIYVYEAEGGAVRRIDAATRNITTVLEECKPPWRKPRPSGCIGPVSELRADPEGNLLFAEFTYNRLSSFNLRTRALAVVAGNGELAGSGDGGLATAAGITVSHCFAFDSKGNILVCDSNHRIRRISADTGIISTIAGNGQRGLAGDHGPAIHAEFVTPLSIAVDRWGNIYVADDTGNRIRRIDASTGIIETIAGSGPPTTGSFSRPEFSGEGELATEARVTSPRSLAFDHAGNLLFVTTGRVCRIDERGYLRTIAGMGQEGFSGDGGLATKARIGPVAITTDEDGSVFLAEYTNNRVRRIDAKSGLIMTIAGNGLPHRPPPSIM